MAKKIKDLKNIRICLMFINLWKTRKIYLSGKYKDHSCQPPEIGIPKIHLPMLFNLKFKEEMNLPSFLITIN